MLDIVVNGVVERTALNGLVVGLLIVITHGLKQGLPRWILTLLHLSIGGRGSVSARPRRPRMIGLGIFTQLKGIAVVIVNGLSYGVNGPAHTEGPARLN